MIKNNKHITKHNRYSESGYTMIELLLATVVGSIVLAGAYVSYYIVEAQYNKNSAIGDLGDFAVPTLKILSRDIRMAGFKAVDTDIESAYGKIDNPFIITDSGNACCDSIEMIYDKSTTERLKVTYFVAPKTNDTTRNALYMTIEQYQSSGAWVTNVDSAIVADFVEDFQAEAVKANAAGEPTLVNLNIVFRSRNKTKTTQTFQKAGFSTGNYVFSITDNYLRDEFETSIYLRNLVD